MQIRVSFGESPFPAAIGIHQQKLDAAPAPPVTDGRNLQRKGRFEESR
jgi:hypothetical protein